MSAKLDVQSNSNYLPEAEGKISKGAVSPIFVVTLKRTFVRHLTIYNCQNSSVFFIMLIGAAVVYSPLRLQNLNLKGETK